MGRVAVELNTLHSMNSYALPAISYDKTKIGLGSLMIRKNGVGADNQWVGPHPVSLMRPFESAVAASTQYIHVIRWSDDIDWVFTGDQAAVGATRTLYMWTYTRSTQVWSAIGKVVLTPPTATNHTMRGFRMTYTKHTTGTAAVSGTAVTGSSTNWQSDRASVGCRIGFGSTDPTQITQWYEISAIGSNTSITLTSSAGTIVDGPYVIEDITCAFITTNATTTNGGLFVAKGLRPEIFTIAGTTISAATTTDCIRAVYWLADAATVTNTVSGGMILEPQASKTSHIVWVVDGTTSVKLFKYNLRATLSLSSGKDTANGFLLVTAAQAVTGTTSQTNNGRYAVTSHGPGNGIACGYFVTTTRVYRTVQLSTIIAGANWQADAMLEVPPGSATTFAASGAFGSIEYIDSIDRFLIHTTHASSVRDYLTQYRSDGGQLDRILGAVDLQLDQSSADAGTIPHYNTGNAAFASWSEGGICYILRGGTSAVTCFMYTFPFAVDWQWAQTSNQYIILPAINTPNADRLLRLYYTHADYLGDAIFGVPTEPVRFKYRLSGIDDNSGAWLDIPAGNDLSSLAPGAQIQFAIEFRIAGQFCLPSRIQSVAIVYDDLSTDSHYQPSIGNSSLTNKRFAWRFSTAFGGSVPDLKIRLYDAVSGTLLLTDTTDAAAYGTFERSTDGGQNWSSWNNTDKGNDTTYIRYTPTTLADNVRVKAILTQK